ncbi:hypothetical protein PR048_009886 [Dryococelus australis]|uniref:Uncharacterized protein n=1 Tax=Dryococelus australis TaxID=614101 RepID=A0ABQ9I313_9NEOP|nr:hypothetical protein PR048_009886 [Dryococelus australis]
MCETRWSEKYKSIRKSSQNFPELVRALEISSMEGNYATRKYAYHLNPVVTKLLLIVALITTAVLESVVNVLQAKSMDLIAVGEHVIGILDVIKKDRKDADRITDEILKKAQDIAMELQTEISVPRLAHKQNNWNNPPSDNKNTPAFALTKLHPLYMTKTSITDLHKNAQLFITFYELDETNFIFPRHEKSPLNFEHYSIVLRRL